MFLDDTHVNSKLPEALKQIKEDGADIHQGYLLVAVLHGFLQLPFGNGVFFELDLLQMLDGCSVEVVELCAKGGCKRERVEET